MANDTKVSNKQTTSQQNPEYDAWFREQVEEGLREADDPNTVMVGNEEVFRELDKRLQQWRQRPVQKKAS